METIHGILFNMQILYSIGLGIYASVLAAKNQSISGDFWGAMLVFSGLNVVTLAIGIVLALSGAVVVSDGRNTIYFLYMAFLIVIMPGLFSLLRGRDDRNAAIAFAILAFFNGSVAISMFQRGLVTWAFPV